VSTRVVSWNDAAADAGGARAGKRDGIFRRA
jgi:hypothetical protein